jgi:hypothetical protein
MVAVTQLGRHGNRHPCQPGRTQHSPTCTQTAVAAAVKLQVTVIVAVDRDPTITAEEGWFGQHSF